jgi:hypothetical protein
MSLWYNRGTNLEVRVAVLEFDPNVEMMRHSAMHASTSSWHPDFYEARTILDVGYRNLTSHETSVHTVSQLGRIICDNGLVDVREGMNAQDQDEEGSANGMVLMRQGKEQIRRSLAKTASLLEINDEDAQDPQLAVSIRGNHALTLHYHLRVQQIMRLSKDLALGNEGKTRLVDDNVATNIVRQEVLENLRHHVDPLDITKAAAFMIQYERVNGGPKTALHIARWALLGTATLARGVIKDPMITLFQTLEAGETIADAKKRQSAIEATLRYETLR